MIKIDDLGMNGEGIAHKNGKAIFLPFYLPEEEIEDNKIVKTSPHRTTPKCKYFKTCGGCNLQHLAYEQSLIFKRNKIQNLLKKFKLDFVVSNCIASENTYAYRNKLTLKCINGILGLYKTNSNDIVEIQSCQIVSKEINNSIKIIKEHSLKNINEIILHSQENEILISFYLNNNNIDNIQKISKKMQIIFKKYGILAYFNKNLIFSSGVKQLTKTDFGITYPFTNDAFYQVNDGVKNKLYSHALKLIDKNDRVVDAYSGCGLMSAILSKKCKSVTGIEIVKEATKNANALKESNSIKNLINLNGDCAKILPTLFDYNKLVLDPPRAGLDKKVITTILNCKPKHILYISCNPATLARDVQLLGKNYKIISITPYDMFPQTAHVEALCLLELNI